MTFIYGIMISPSEISTRATQQAVLPSSNPKQFLSSGELTEVEE